MKLKRFEAVFLAFCLMVALLPGRAYATVADSGDGWTLDDGGVLTITEIPFNRSVPAGWASQAEGITQVVLGPNVTEVEGSDFQECVNLISFKVDPENNALTTENGVLYNKDKTMLLCYPAAHTETYAGHSGLFMVPESVEKIQITAFAAFVSGERALDIYAYENTVSSVKAAVKQRSGDDFPNTSTVHTYIPVEGVSLNKETLSLEIGGTETLSAAVTPENATFPAISWSTEGAQIATVDAGTVTGVSAGTTNIVVTTADGGKTAKSAATVLKKAVNGLSLSADSLTIDKEASAALTATVTPFDATYKTITFLSTDRTVVEVSAGGSVRVDAATGAITLDAEANEERTAASASITVTAKGTGAASVVAITQDGGLSTVCSVIVPEVSLNQTELTLGMDQTETLFATVRPGNASVTSTEWSSDAESVAVVDANGKITPKGTGTAKITVSVTTGEKTYTADCAVTVRQAAVSRVTLNTNRLNLDLVTKTSDTLTATVHPAGINGGSVSWKSSDETVASVSGGTVTAKKAGTAVITASVAEGEKTYTADCAVTVAATRVSGVTLKKGDTEVTELELALDETETLTAILSPDEPTETGVTWLSTDPQVVSLTENGAVATLKAEAVGTARIIAVANDGAKTASCLVTVPATEITKFELDNTTLVLTRTADGGNVSGTLTAAVEPETATYAAVNWYSSDSGVVTVSGSGASATVTTVGPGKAAVVAQTADGKRVSCAVTVWDAATGASVSRSALTLAPTETATLYAVILPSTADQRVTWSSDQTEVATVDAATGIVTAHADGTATITATSSANSGIKAVCTVTVRTSVTGVSLKKDGSTVAALTLDEGGSATLTAEVAPDEATNKTVTWISYNKDVATVSGGVVTAVAPGTTTILAVTDEGAKTAECAVTVNATRVTGITLNRSAVTLGLNDTDTLTATVAPETASNQTVTWSSSNTDVVAVSGGRISSGNAEGEATITAKITDNGKEFTASCTVTVRRNAVTRVTLSANELTLNLTNHTSATLSATVKPDDADNASVIWASSDRDVAEVSGGTVTAKSAGSSVITVTTADGAYQATCTVTVEATKVTGLTLTPAALELNENDTGTLSATVSGDGETPATNTTVKWFTTDDTVISVDSSGNYTARHPGKAVIIASTADGGFTKYCAVTVYQPVDTVAVHKTAVTLNVGETDTLMAKITPDGASKTVTWASSDPGVATVNASTGVVTAVAGGTAVITAEGADGKTGTCTVTVRTAVTGVSLSQTTALLELGGTDTAATVTLTATVAPGTATKKTVRWYTSDESVAEVDQNGTVTAKKAGSAAIIAVTDDGGKTASCVITVRDAVTSVTLDQGSLSLMKGTSGGLIATVNPSATADQSVIWSSSDASVATVTNGVVVALATGTATITATSVADQTKSASCDVTVTPVVVSAGSVTLDQTSLTLSETGTAELTATVTPDTATNQLVTWSSTNPDVATVENGTVTAKKPGTATILAATADGSHMAYCAVTVQASVTGVTLGRTAMTIGLGQTTEILTATVEPYNAVNKNLTWTITGANSAGVIELSGDGSSRTVIPKQPGTATVKVTTADGGKTAECVVTVSPTAVSSATISAKSLTLIAGQTIETPLTVTIEPNDSTEPTTVWSTSDSTVATVANGTVTATAKTGTALITATVTDKAGQVYTASCAVTVKPVEVTGITLNQTSASLAKGTDETLSATVNPGNATDQTVLWRSGNETVATVDANGKITAVGAGTATITATTKDGGYTAACAVTVTSTEVTGLTLNKPALSLIYVEGAEGTETLTASLAGGGNNPAVSWRSSNEAVATVANGVVTAAGKGTAIITAKATENGNDFIASCTVTVWASVTGLTLSPGSAVLELGGEETAKTTTLEARVAPAAASDKTVLWYTSDSEVATVSNGAVTAVNPGSAVITAVTADGGYAESCVVTVRNAIRSLRLSKNVLTLTEGETEALVVTITDGADSSVIWSKTESAEGVITLANGVVTANKAGTATITVTSGVNDGFQDICTVTVNAPTTAVTGVTLNKSALTDGVLALNLTDHNTTKLTYTIAPEHPTNAAVTWQSTNTNVAVVDQEGNVTARGAGDTVIIVTTTDGRFTDQCTVRVEGKRVAGVSLDQTTLELYVGGNGTLAPVFNPTDAANKAVSWSSSDNGVAIVDGAGKVYARGEGTATITVTTSDGAKTATCAVTVKSGIESITLPEALTLAKGSSGSVGATILPGAAGNLALTWVSGNEEVATVNEKGVVTALKAGTAVITAKHTNADETKTSNECVVTVTQPVTGVTLNKAALSLAEGGSEKLTATVAPSDAGSKSVEWASSDTTVAEVNGGTVTAKKAGTATISVKTEDGGFIAMCIVTVGATEVEGLTVSPSSDTLTVGGDRQLTAVVTPSGATYGSVTWFTSNADVATVNQDGVVHAVAPGTAAIVAATQDGIHTATCLITVQSVVVAVTEISLAPTTLEMNAGENRLLTAAVGPDDATNKTVTWRSSADAVAEVDENGIVTAKRSGTAVITAAAGGQTASCTVTVRTSVSGVALSEDSITLSVNATRQLTATVSPTGASNTSLKWLSSDTGVATVSDDGLVTAKKGGTANIIVSTVDGGYTARCAVTVPVAVTSVTPNKTRLTLSVNDEEPLTATVLPLDAAERDVTWGLSADSDADVVSVSADGTVRALKDGTVTVTATAGGVTGTCEVTVQADRVTHVSLDPALTIDAVGSTKTLTAAVEATGGQTYTLSWSAAILDGESGDVVEITGSGSTVTVAAKRVGTAKVTVTAGSYTAACVVTVPPVGVSGVALKKDGSEIAALTIEKGGSAALSAVVTAGATNQEVTWLSSDPSVASVSADGASATVTAGYAGTATITVVTQDGGHTASCVITVPELSLGKSSLRLTAGETEPMVAILTPSGLGIAVNWATSDRSVATVDSQGVVTAIAAGEATITATFVKDGIAIPDVYETCAVKVVERAGLSLNKAELSLTTGGNETLRATVTPDDAANKDVTWISTDASVATVDSNGKVTAVKAGSAAIIASTADGYTDTCAVAVRSAVTGVALPSAKTLVIGVTDEATLSADVATTGGNRDVTWFSSNTGVATVDANGKVRAVSNGTAVIIATAVDGGTAAASCTVTVWNKTTSVALSKSELILAVGDGWPLTATVNPGANPEVVWSVVGENACVQISDDGIVTALEDGFATIRATAADDSEVYDECRVTVRDSVVSAAVATPEMTISEQAADGSRTVTLSQALNDAIYYYTDKDAKLKRYTGEITVTEDTTIKAYAVEGSLQSPVITGVVTVSEKAGQMALTDSNGNTVETVAEGTEGGEVSFTAYVPLANPASKLYLAVYDTDGAMISLEEHIMDTSGGGTVYSHEFSLNIDSDVKIGEIRLMALSEDMEPATDSGSISGD